MICFCFALFWASRGAAKEEESVMAKGFEEFEPIFKEVNAEWENPVSSPLLPFLLHVHALDATRIRIHVTDFHSYTWEGIRSIQQLEDLRDDIGVGGSWSEFVDYLIASVKSDHVKLILGGHFSSAGENGATFAKLIAHKSKGMPLISLALDRLISSSANDAMANLSMELFKAYQSKHTLVVKEQESSYRLTKILSAEQEKNESLQNQLNTVLFSKRQKLRMSNTSDKAFPVSDHFSNSDEMSISDSSEKPSAQDPLSAKVGQRAVPAYRRAKVRGVLLQDTEDDDDK